MLPIISQITFVFAMLVHFQEPEKGKPRHTGHRFKSRWCGAFTHFNYSPHHL